MQQDQSQTHKRKFNVRTYAQVALPHLESLLNVNESVMTRLVEQLIANVEQKRTLFIFGSGHSSLLSMEIYHRAGGPSFVVPLIAEYLLPMAGPPVVRQFERTEGSASHLLARAGVQQGEMIWLVSQSGINPAIIDLALRAKKAGLETVAFTSLMHSKSVASRHSSGKRLFEICDHTLDLGGRVGDASIEINTEVSTGPLSTLGAVFLAHSILSATCARLEEKGIRCTYTSVNTPEGEKRNKSLEEVASIRDPLLR